MNYSFTENENVCYKHSFHLTDQRMIFFFVQIKLRPTDAVAVCKAKNAFDLVECHMLLDLYHIPVELGGCTVGSEVKC